MVAVLFLATPASTQLFSFPAALPLHRPPHRAPPAPPLLEDPLLLGDHFAQLLHLRQLRVELAPAFVLRLLQLAELVAQLLGGLLGALHLLLRALELAILRRHLLGELLDALLRRGSVLAIFLR